MHNNILIEFVLTNECNKRCKYCDLDFHGAKQTKENIDAFISFLEKNAKDVHEYIINFFGGEPLLEFDSIIEVLERTKHIENLSFTLGTNGILLDENKYKILQNFGVKIYLSIDTETYEHIFKKDFLLQDIELMINFILNPETLNISFEIFERLVKHGFKKFSIIPVYITIAWWLDAYRKLKEFVHFSKKFRLSHDIQADFYSYYDKPTSDTQFILDTNANFYRDMHTHLWFLKQFQIVPDKMKKEIESFSHIWSVFDENTVWELCDAYERDEIVKKSFLTPKYIGFEPTLRIIDKIISS